MLIYFIRTDLAHSQEVWTNLVQQLPPDLKAKNERFRFLIDRFRNLFGLLLLQRAFVTQENQPFDFESLTYDQNKRPYLKHINTDFNISHSGDLVVCAYSKNTRVGIDVELIRQVELSDFQSTMNAEQWREIYASKNPYHTFFQYWTVKESVIKADGRGLAIPLEEIFIVNEQVRFDGKDWFIQPLRLDEQHKACLASDQEIESLEIQELTWEQLR